MKKKKREREKKNKTEQNTQKKSNIQTSKHPNKQNPIRKNHSDNGNCIGKLENICSNKTL